VHWKAFSKPLAAVMADLVWIELIKQVIPGNRFSPIDGINRLGAFLTLRKHSPYGRSAWRDINVVRGGTYGTFG